MDIPNLKRRDANTHKGTFGRALIVGGSRGMAGAVALAGMAATKSGAGLTTLAVPDCCLETVAGFDPTYMTVPLANDERGRLHGKALPNLVELMGNATSIGLGPGLSASPYVCDLVLDLYLGFSGPMVVDADGLNALATATDMLKAAAGPRILTPHIGEFRRLMGTETGMLTPEECRERVQEFAAENKVIVVLKGHRSIVTDGSTQYENQTGNPGMASGGSGDVLTGVITALLGQDLTPIEAAVLGVHVHGLAGDLARDAIGEISMTASDTKDYLAAAFRKLV